MLLQQEWGVSSPLNSVRVIFALQLMRAPSTGIEESLKIQENVEKQLLKAFPEIKAILQEQEQPRLLPMSCLQIFPMVLFY